MKICLLLITLIGLSACGADYTPVQTPMPSGGINYAYPAGTLSCPFLPGPVRHHGH